MGNPDMVAIQPEFFGGSLGNLEPNLRQEEERHCGKEKTR